MVSVADGHGAFTNSEVMLFWLCNMLVAQTLVSGL